MHAHSAMSNGAKSVNMLSVMLFDLYLGGQRRQDERHWAGTRSAAAALFGTHAARALRLGPERGPEQVNRPLELWVAAWAAAARPL